MLEKVKKARETHKKMGSRILYHYLKIEEIGINKFEKMISENNLGVKRKRKKPTTTLGFYEQSDRNLINGLVLEDINQLISGDITYFEIFGEWHYIFTLKDAYSKRIVGLYGSKTMQSANAVKTLRQCIKVRGKKNLENTIHHTDAGSQYKSKAYKSLLQSCNMKMSIAENCLENGMAEQLNFILKSGYLEGENLKNEQNLNHCLQRIKKLLNEERPVAALGYKTPIEFENWLTTIKKEERPKQKLYDFTEARKQKLMREFSEA